jgi:anti-sigma factor (TIGR02949 family)
MTCREAIAVLGEYLDAALGPDVATELEEHLRDCPACVAYLNTYRRTREVAAGAIGVAMPEEMKARVRRFLLARLHAPAP